MKIMIIALVVAMLLLAGCPGAGTGTQGGTSAGTQGAGTQGGALGGSSGASGGAGTGSSGAGTSGSGTTGGSTGGSDPFANWDMNAMIASGQPVYCEVTYNTQDFTGTYKIYLKGENVRTESSASGGMANAAVTIMKGKKVYMQYSEPADMGNGVTCSWVYMDMDTITACMPEDTEAQGSTEMDKYDETPANYNCNYGTFGDEKFTAPSVPASCDLSQQICDAYEAMQQMEDSGYADAMAACEGLEGEALQSCLQAQFGTGG